MKTRNGFVSNSSSSSFLVGFEKKPDSVEELRQLLYGDKQSFPGYGWDPKTQKTKALEYSTLELADRVYKDMENSATPTQIVRTLADVSDWDNDDYSIPGDPQESDFIIENPEDPYNNIDWVAYGKARAEAARNLVRESLGVEHEKLVWYLFHYSDEDGSFFSILEHDGTFENLPHVCISHH